MVPGEAGVLTVTFQCSFCGAVCKACLRREIVMSGRGLANRQEKSLEQNQQQVKRPAHVCLKHSLEQYAKVRRTIYGR